MSCKPRCSNTSLASNVEDLRCFARLQANVVTCRNLKSSRANSDIKSVTVNKIIDEGLVPRPNDAHAQVARKHTT